jgi:hypothetical protein
LLQWHDGGRRRVFATLVDPPFEIALIHTTDARSDGNRRELTGANQPPHRCSTHAEMLGDLREVQQAAARWFVSHNGTSVPDADRALALRAPSATNTTVVVPGAMCALS